MKRIFVIALAIIMVVAMLMSLSTSAATMYRRGDADKDGEITSADVTWIQRKIANRTVEPFNKTAADVDKEGLEIIDATYIQRYLAKGPNPYKVGELFDPYELPFIPKQ